MDFVAHFVCLSHSDIAIKVVSYTVNQKKVNFTTFLHENIKNNRSRLRLANVIVLIYCRLFFWITVYNTIVSYLPRCCSVNNLTLYNTVQHWLSLLDCWGLSPCAERIIYEPIFPYFLVFIPKMPLKITALLVGLIHFKRCSSSVHIYRVVSLNFGLHHLSLAGVCVMG